MGARFYPLGTAGIMWTSTFQSGVFGGFVKGEENTAVNLGASGNSELILSNMVGLQYDGDYILSTSKGTISESSFNFVYDDADTSYNIYLRDVGGGSYYFVAYNTTSSQWFAGFTGTNPNSWVGGSNIGNTFLFENIVATSETVDGANSPDSTDLKVSYIAGVSAYGWFAQKNGEELEFKSLEVVDLGVTDDSSYNHN